MSESLLSPSLPAATHSVSTSCLLSHSRDVFLQGTKFLPILIGLLPESSRVVAFSVSIAKETFLFVIRSDDNACSGSSDKEFCETYRGLCVETSFGKKSPCTL